MDQWSSGSIYEIRIDHNFQIGLAFDGKALPLVGRHEEGRGIGVVSQNHFGGQRFDQGRSVRAINIHD